MSTFVIKDDMTGRYYTGRGIALPAMGATRKEAMRFDDRMEAAAVLRQFPLTVLASVEECFCSDGGGFICTACKEDAERVPEEGGNG